MDCVINGGRGRVGRTGRRPAAGGGEVGVAFDAIGRTMEFAKGRIS